MAVEAIVIAIGDEKLIVPTEIAKKLYKELGELFGKPEKEYIPWPVREPTIIYKNPEWWSGPYYVGDVPTHQQPKIWNSNGTLTIDCAVGSDVTASYSVL